MNSSYRVVIFDLDGTLLDTLEDLKNAVNYALNTCGYPERTYKEVQAFVGNGVKSLIRRAVPKETNEADTEYCLSLFREFYALHSQDNTKPYEGISELLNNLRASGVKIAVVSNKFDQAVKYLCRDYFEDMIDIAVGESENIPKKPAPDSVLSVLRLLDVEKEEGIYVGDSEVDIMTARNAGVKSVGVTWGFRDRQLLVDKKADYIIDSPYELLDIIKG